MTLIILDASDWVDAADFYDSVLPALGAPDWHGRNLDALNDSIRGDDINSVKQPFEIRFLGCDSMGAGAREVLDGFITLIDELRAEGSAVTLTCERPG